MTWDKFSLTMPNPHREVLDELLRPHATILTYPAKKMFLEPGEMTNGIYYVAEGRTRHYMMSPDGMEKILYTLSAGWFFGETPCDLQLPTGLYSKTEVKTTIYKIPMQTYEQLLVRNRLFREAIHASYAKKMLIMRHEIESLAFHSVKDRLKRLFCSTADTTSKVEGNWYKLRVSYTQYEVSTIVGGARVTVSKLINELCAEGFIRMLNRSVQINVNEYEKFIRSMEKY